MFVSRPDRRVNIFFLLCTEYDMGEENMSNMKNSLTALAYMFCVYYNTKLFTFFESVNNAASMTLV